MSGRKVDFVLVFLVTNLGGGGGASGGSSNSTISLLSIDSHDHENFSHGGRQRLSSIQPRKLTNHQENDLRFRSYPQHSYIKVSGNFLTSFTTKENMKPSNEREKSKLCFSIPCYQSWRWWRCQ
jgi:hypothetical protein